MIFLNFENMSLKGDEMNANDQDLSDRSLEQFFTIYYAPVQLRVFSYDYEHDE